MAEPGDEERAGDPWAASGRADDPALWADDPVSPYRTTAFDVLGLPVELLSRSDQLTRVRRRLRRARAGLVWVDGEPVDEAAVHGAEAQLARIGSRLAQNLLVHTPHAVPIEVEDLRERLAALPVEPADPGPLALDRPALLALLDEAGSAPGPDGEERTG